MKIERWRTVAFLILLLILTLFVRIFFLKPQTVTIVLEEELYQNALIGTQGIYTMRSFRFEEYYTKALSCSMFLFGNGEMAGVYLNIVLQTIAIVCIYFAMVMVAHSYAAFLVAAVVSLIPFYSDKVYEISSFHLLILLYAIGLLILAILSKGVYMFAIRKKTMGQKQEEPQNDVQEETSGVITLDDIIGKDTATEAENTEITPPGMKEIILDEEEKKKKVKFIENPLPVPKRREHKEMDYTLDIGNDKDDYDIKDVAGMDFFDIE